jgi:invasion protein IalB
MIFAGKALAFGIGAALALSAGTGGASAQNKSKGDKGAAAQPQAAAQKKPDIWVKLCGDVPMPDPFKPGEQPKAQKPEEMKKTHVCMTQVDVRDTQTALLIGRLAIRQTADQPNPQILIMVPLQSALATGVLVKIDDKEPFKLAYISCDQGGCYAEGNIEAAVVDQMKSGKQIAYLRVDGLGQASSIPLPLEGFATAIEGEPTPIEKYNEGQRKMAEIVSARLAELRKKQEEAAQSGQAGAAPAQTVTKSDKKAN